MDRKLFVQAMAKFSLGVVLVGTLLFLPAGTADYPYGWRLMGVLFVPMFLAGLVMMARAPGLLRKRLNARESQMQQSRVIRLSGCMFVAGFVLAGLDFRFGWSRMPGWVSWCGCASFLLAYVMYALVLRENEFLSRTVEVQQGQRVVDTGLYAVVRHPMYAATVLLFLSMPVILGSWAALAVFLVYPFLLVRRIENEEQVLEQGLAGYREYKQRVKYRMIPFVW